MNRIFPFNISRGFFLSSILKTNIISIGPPSRQPFDTIDRDPSCSPIITVHGLPITDHTRPDDPLIQYFASLFGGKGHINSVRLLPPPSSSSSHLLSILFSDNTNAAKVVNSWNNSTHEFNGSQFTISIQNPKYLHNFHPYPIAYISHLAQSLRNKTQAETLITSTTDLTPGKDFKILMSSQDGRYSAFRLEYYNSKTFALLSVSLADIARVVHDREFLELPKNEYILIFGVNYNEHLDQDLRFPESLLNKLKKTLESKPLSRKTIQTIFISPVTPTSSSANPPDNNDTGKESDSPFPQNTLILKCHSKEKALLLLQAWIKNPPLYQNSPIKLVPFDPEFSKGIAEGFQITSFPNQTQPLESTIPILKSPHFSFADTPIETHTERPGIKIHSGSKINSLDSEVATRRRMASFSSMETLNQNGIEDNSDNIPSGTQPKEYIRLLESISQQIESKDAPVVIAVHTSNSPFFIFNDGKSQNHFTTTHIQDSLSLELDSHFSNPNVFTDSRDSSKHPHPEINLISSLIQNSIESLSKNSWEDFISHLEQILRMTTTNVSSISFLPVMISSKSTLLLSYQHRSDAQKDLEYLSLVFTKLISNVNISPTQRQFIPQFTMVPKLPKEMNISFPPYGDVSKTLIFPNCSLSDFEDVSNILSKIGFDSPTSLTYNNGDNTNTRHRTLTWYKIDTATRAFETIRHYYPKINVQYAMPPSIMNSLLSFASQNTLDYYFNNISIYFPVPLEFLENHGRIVSIHGIPPSIGADEIAVTLHSLDHSKIPDIISHASIIIPLFPNAISTSVAKVVCKTEQEASILSSYLFFNPILRFHSFHPLPSLISISQDFYLDHVEEDTNLNTNSNNNSSPTEDGIPISTPPSTKYLRSFPFTPISNWISCSFLSHHEIDFLSLSIKAKFSDLGTHNLEFGVEKFTENLFLYTIDFEFPNAFNAKSVISGKILQTLLSQDMSFQSTILHLDYKSNQNSDTFSSKTNIGRDLGDMNPKIQEGSISKFRNSDDTTTTSDFEEDTIHISTSCNQPPFSSSVVKITLIHSKQSLSESLSTKFNQKNYPIFSWPINMLNKEEQKMLNEFPFPKIPENGDPSPLNCNLETYYLGFDSLSSAITFYHDFHLKTFSSSKTSFNSTTLFISQPHHIQLRPSMLLVEDFRDLPLGFQHSYPRQHSLPAESFQFHSTLKRLETASTPNHITTSIDGIQNSNTPKFSFTQFVEWNPTAKQTTNPHISTGSLLPISGKPDPFSDENINFQQSFLTWTYNFSQFWKEFPSTSYRLWKSNSDSFHMLGKNIEYFTETTKATPHISGAAITRYLQSSNPNSVLAHESTTLPSSRFQVGFNSKDIPFQDLNSMINKQKKRPDVQAPLISQGSGKHGEFTHPANTKKRISPISDSQIPTPDVPFPWPLDSNQDPLRISKFNLSSILIDHFYSPATIAHMVSPVTGAIHRLTTGDIINLSLPIMEKISTFAMETCPDQSPEDMNKSIQQPPNYNFTSFINLPPSLEAFRAIISTLCLGGRIESDFKKFQRDQLQESAKNSFSVAFVDETGLDSILDLAVRDISTLKACNFTSIFYENILTRHPSDKSLNWGREPLQKDEDILNSNFSSLYSQWTLFISSKTKQKQSKSGNPTMSEISNSESNQISTTNSVLDKFDSVDQLAITELDIKSHFPKNNNLLPEIENSFQHWSNMDLNTTLEPSLLLKIQKVLPSLNISFLRFSQLSSSSDAIFAPLDCFQRLLPKNQLISPNNNIIGANSSINVMQSFDPVHMASRIPEFELSQLLFPNDREFVWSLALPSHHSFYSLDWFISSFPALFYQHPFLLSHFPTEMISTHWNWFTRVIRYSTVNHLILDNSQILHLSDAVDKTDAISMEHTETEQSSTPEDIPTEPFTLALKTVISLVDIHSEPNLISPSKCLKILGIPGITRSFYSKIHGILFVTSQHFHPIFHDKNLLGVPVPSHQIGVKNSQTGKVQIFDGTIESVPHPGELVIGTNSSRCSPSENNSQYLDSSSLSWIPLKPSLFVSCISCQEYIDKNSSFEENYSSFDIKEISSLYQNVANISLDTIPLFFKVS